MNRLRLVLLPLLAGALFATVDAQPAPPAPPAPPEAPRAPRAPRAPKAPRAPLPPPDPWRGDLGAQIKVQLRESLGESIAEIERDDDIPPAIKARILKAMRKAHKSGDPRDLAELGDASQWGADLSSAIEAEVEEELRKAGIRGGRRGGVDLGRALQDDDEGDDDGDDGDDGDEDDVPDDDDRDSSADVDLDDADRAARDQARAAHDQARAARDQARAARDQARAARDHDSWAPYDDSQDFGSPFDDPKLGWLGNLALGPGVGPIPDVRIDLDLDLDLDDLRLDRGKLAELDRIASEEQAATEPAEREVKRLGRQLQHNVSAANPNEVELGRLVDLITVQEGQIRKARLSALIRTRKLLGK